ncbi:hypothetical protein ACIBAG_42305 [Streptomyces sp. NPDC051243]|uniref:hypothetical protein n=1 Tax=Streptomyces sp. NPDC051243 TaxID=3365646 RepID=UPI0037B615B0
MQGDVADEQSAAALARDLQPPEHRAKSDFSAPVSEDDLRRMDVRHGRVAQRLQANVDRRLRDRQLVVVLARCGFQGQEYDHFVEELVRYGVSVLRGWMHSGYIFRLVADRGFGLTPHELDLEELASDSDLREDLATMTVARALPPFRQRALVEGRWAYEGGASITTYFMGACLYAFPNEFRRHRATKERQRRVLQGQLAVYEGPVHPFSTADEVASRQQVLEELRAIKDRRTQAAVALTVDGYTQEEIRELLDEKSARVIEGLLYRWRRKAQRRQGGEQCG